MKISVNSFAWVVVWEDKAFAKAREAYSDNDMQILRWLIKPPKSSPLTGVGVVAMSDAKGSTIKVTPSTGAAIVDKTARKRAGTVITIHPVAGTEVEAKKWLTNTKFGKYVENNAANYALSATLVEID